MISSETKGSPSHPEGLSSRYGLTVVMLSSDGTHVHQRVTCTQVRLLFKALSASLLIFCIAGPSCIPTDLDHHEEQVLDSIPEYPGAVTIESSELDNQPEVEQDDPDDVDLIVEVNTYAAQEVYEGELVTFSARSCIIDDNLLYSWSQVSGTPVQISVTNQPTLTFVAPTPNGDTEMLSFQVAVELPKQSTLYTKIPEINKKQHAIGTITISIISLDHLNRNARFSLLDPDTGIPISEGFAPFNVRFAAYTLDNTFLLADGQYCWSVEDANGIIENCGPFDTHHNIDYVFTKAGIYTVSLTLLRGTSHISLVNQETGNIQASMIIYYSPVIPNVSTFDVDNEVDVCEGNKWYVDSINGSNDNDGTSWDNAWLTLQYMSSQIYNDNNPGGSIRSGDIVHLRGTFYEGLKPSLPSPYKANISFVGADSPLIYSRGTSWALDLTNRNGYTFDNITFQTSGPELPKEDREYPLAVAFIRGGCYNVFRNCTFKNAGLVGEMYVGARAVVELIWNSNYNEFYNCTAIAEEFPGETPAEFGVFGRRVWGVIGSSHNLFSDCISYGSSVAISTEGEGVDFTIYGSHQKVSEGIFELRPCIGNLVIRHTSHNANLYGLGITAGDSYCKDNWFIDCVVYAMPNAISGGHVTARSDRGLPLECTNNGWDNCVVYCGEIAGKQLAGFQVIGMANVIARNCQVYGLAGTTQCGFRLYTVGSANANGSFTVINPIATGVDILVCSYGDTPCIVSE